MSDGNLKDLILTIGPSTYKIRQADRWNIWAWDYAGSPIMANQGSTNGTVFEVQKTWAGGRHGGELLTHAELSVDGVNRRPAVPGAVSATQRAILDTMSTFGAAAMVETITVFHAHGFSEQVRILGTDARKQISTPYIHLWSRSTAFTAWKGWGKPMDGELLQKKTTSSVQFLGDCTHVVMTSGSHTLTTQLSIPCARVFLTPRAEDVKLYVREDALVGPAERHWASTVTHWIE